MMLAHICFIPRNTRSIGTVRKNNKALTGMAAIVIRWSSKVVAVVRRNSSVAVSSIPSNVVPKLEYTKYAMYFSDKLIFRCREHGTKQANGSKRENTNGRREFEMSHAKRAEVSRQMAVAPPTFDYKKTLGLPHTNDISCKCNMATLCLLVEWYLTHMQRYVILNFDYI